MGLKNKKKIIIVVIITLIISISTVSYALWTTTHIQTGQNSITTGCLDIKFTEGDSINIINGYPITDEAGKKSKGTTFSITNTCTIPVAYEVVLDEITTTLADSNLKINVSGSREIEPVLLSEMSETTPVPLSDQEVSSARSILKDVVPGAEASGQTGGKKTYVLRLWINQDITENLGSGKEFKGRIAIRANQINKNDKILVNNIIANNPIQTETPDFSKGCPNDSESCTSGLYKAEDDQGESYYFRGAVENNYVKFADMLWRIVRINGDGTIRLILNDKIDTDSMFNYFVPSSKPVHEKVGFTMGNNTNCTQSHPCEVTYDSNSNSFNNENFGGTNSDIKTTLETWYTNNLKDVNEKIATGYFCNDTSSPRYVHNSNSTAFVFYGAFDRIYTDHEPSLKCPNPADNSNNIRTYGGIYKLKIGLITADEMNMSGLSWYEPNADETNYLYHDYWWWSMSPNYSETLARVFEVYRGHIYRMDAVCTYAVVPVINLKSDIKVTGNGSEQSPYVVN